MPTTNYVYLLKNDAIVYPKTKLSAIDMTLGGYIEITGETMSLSVASAQQIKQGTAGRVITADGLKSAIETYSDALYTLGNGVDVSDGTISLASVDVKEAIAGNVKLTNPIDNKSLNGAVNMGRAVDVSSVVDRNTFIVTTNNGIITLTVSNASSTAYYYGWATKFPKYAAGLKYLFLADVKNVGDAVTSYIGTETTGNILGITGVPYSKAHSQNESTFTRMASCFTTEGNVSFFVSRGSATSINIQLKNFKVFEVTALNDEAIYALATAENPDEIYEKFLIKQDAVCPWIHTINMGNSPAVTIGAGLAYSLIANDGNVHELMIDTFPNDAYGREAYLTVFVDDTSHVHVNDPLILMDALTPNAANNCVIRFRDGYARMYVSDTDYGYAVTVTSGTTDGSLYYGLITDTGEYITFAATTDETDITVDINSAPVTRNKNLLGNGVDKTVVDFSNHTVAIANGAVMRVQSATIKNGTLSSGTIELTNAGIDGVTSMTSGGTMQFARVTTLNGTITNNGGDFVWVNGATVTGSGAFDEQNVSGAGFGNGHGENHPVVNGVRVDFDGITFTNGFNTTMNGGGGLCIRNNTDPCRVNSCMFSSNSAAAANSGSTDTGGGFYVFSGAVVMTNCTFANNYSNRQGGALTAGGEDSIIELSSCVVSSNSCSVNSTYGGGCYLYHCSDAKLIDCEFTSNYARQGAGVYVWETSSCTIENCTFQNHSGYYYTLVIHNTSNAVVSRCTFTNNNQDLYTVCVNGQSKQTVVLFDSCTVAYNSTTDAGAGMMVISSGSANISNCIITGNTAGSRSGTGVMPMTGHARVYNTNITNNKASTFGAAIQTGTAANYSLNMESCTITGNTCGTFGVITHRGSVPITISKCYIADNVAPEGGSLLALTHTAHTQFIDCQMLDGDIYVIPNSATAPIVTFGGSNTFLGNVTGNPSILTIHISSGGTMNLTNNENEYVLSAGAKIIVGYDNNGTWTMGGSATVINSAGTTLTISGSGTKLSNAGVLS